MIGSSPHTIVIAAPTAVTSATLRGSAARSFFCASSSNSNAGTIRADPERCRIAPAAAPAMAITQAVGGSIAEATVSGRRRSPRAPPFPRVRPAARASRNDATLAHAIANTVIAAARNSCPLCEMLSAWPRIARRDACAIRPRTNPSTEALLAMPIAVVEISVTVHTGVRTRLAHRHRQFP